MSSFHLHLSNRPLSHPATRRTSLSIVYYEALSLTWLLVISIGILWMNQAWVTGMWQLALFVFAAINAFLLPRTVELPGTTPLLFACGIPIWGALQMLFGRSAYDYASLLAAMSWMTFPAAMLLGLILLREHRRRDMFLLSLWLLSVGVIALELYQLLVLGRYTVLSSGYPLMSSNLFAELAELLLPAVLATSLRVGNRLWLGCFIAALLLGTTIAAGARMGSVLLVLEIVAVFLAARRMPGYRRLGWRKHGFPLMLILGTVLALEGTANLNGRMRATRPLEGRSEVAQSALRMIRSRPIAGFGLGAFPVVYPQFAKLQTRGFVNHVHDDFLEIAVEGGAVGLVLWLIVLATSLPVVRKAPWAFGHHRDSSAWICRLPALPPPGDCADGDPACRGGCSPRIFESTT